MKRLLTALVLCTTGSLAFAQNTAKYDELANELEIMSGVLKRRYVKMHLQIIGA